MSFQERANLGLEEYSKQYYQLPWQTLANSLRCLKSKQISDEETKRLESYISKKNLWITTIDFNQYVSEGAEQRVFLKARPKQPFYRIV